MSIKCPYCGGTPSKKIPIWVSSIKCEWCGQTYEIYTPNLKLENQVFKRKFDLYEFKHFLEIKKNIKTFDPVSGILMIFGKQVEISEDGTVYGESAIKNRIEKWIFEFLSSE